MGKSIGGQSPPYFYQLITSWLSSLIACECLFRYFMDIPSIFCSCDKVWESNHHHYFASWFFSSLCRILANYKVNYLEPDFGLELPLWLSLLYFHQHVLESLIAIAVDDDVFEGKSQLMFDSCNLSQSQHSPLLAEKSFSASPLSWFAKS